MEAERKAALRAARRRRIILAAVVALLIVGLMVLFSVLGNDKKKGDEDSAPATTTTTVPDKPEVTVPTTPPPTTLQSTDLVVGKGAEAREGSAVEVHYVGKIYATGKEFDSSYERKEPIPFTIGEGGVIPGWDQGVAGMRVGGRRQLIVPPDLAYGAQGQPPDIPANSTLVFVIDLMSVKNGG